MLVVGCSPIQLKTSEAVPTVDESDLEVKSWLAHDEGVEAERPSHCAKCGVAAYRDDRLRLHGHGIRIRTVWGPAQPDGRSATWEVVTRRYRCTVCGAVRTVQRRGLKARLRYSLPAIALALMAWAVMQWPAPEVRRQLSPWKIQGASDAGRWRSLLRWTRRAEELFELPSITAETTREGAARAADLVRARGPTDHPPWEQTFIGAGAY